MDTKDEIIKLYEEFVELLTDELNETVGIAVVHGWKSTRVNKGKVLRDKMKTLKEKLEV